MRRSSPARTLGLQAGEGWRINHWFYHIALRGQVGKGEVNEMSPLPLQWEKGDSMVTQFSVATDQSGLIGLLRHLHNLGYIFHALNCDQS